MKDRISLPGLLLGALTALAAGLLVSHYSFAWLVIGVALGMVIGSALARRNPLDPIDSRLPAYNELTRHTPDVHTQGNHAHGEQR